MTGFEPAPDVRLLERWLRVEETGGETTRERLPMMAFPAQNRLYGRGARCLLAASRDAVLASLLPEDADRSRFLRRLLIHTGEYFAGQRNEA